ncbi:MAG: hypothetical protein PHS62_01100 [Patescibacteria group bacterium]|nr:hypothetical protein [Patescibacteria group bacterium]
MDLWNPWRSVAHLQEQLGQERFLALIDPVNTGKVREFCDELIRTTLPTEMTVGDRTYEIINFTKEEPSMFGAVLINQESQRSGRLQGEDMEHILKRQQDIPASLRCVILIFPISNGYGLEMRGLYWSKSGTKWFQVSFNALGEFDGRYRLLRRKEIQRQGAQGA